MPCQIRSSKEVGIPSTLLGISKMIGNRKQVSGLHPLEEVKP